MTDTIALLVLLLAALVCWTGSAPNTRHYLARTGSTRDNSTRTGSASNSLDDPTRAGFAPNSRDNHARTGSAPISRDNSLRPGSAPNSRDNQLRPGFAPDSRDNQARNGPVPGFHTGLAGRRFAPNFRHYVAAGVIPAMLVLCALTGLGAEVREAGWAVAAGVGGVGVLALTRRLAVHAPVVPIAVGAWTLTCLGAVTAERLNPGVGQARWVVLALAGFVVAAWVAPHLGGIGSRGGGWVAGVGSVLLLAPLLPGIGARVSGAPGWVSIGPVTGQPAELGRPLVIIGTAAMLAAAGSSLRAGRLRATLLACWPLPIAAVAAMAADDLGPLLLLGLAVVAMVLLNKPRPLHTLALLGALLGGGALVFALVGKLHNRLEQMLHPITDDGRLHNTGAALRLMVDGGWFGSGFGAGATERVVNIDNDFVLAALGGERGFLGLLLVLAIAAAVTDACWRTASSAADGGLRLGGYGLSALLSAQLIYTTLATMTALPVTGVVVPFLSRGGSALIGVWVVLGLIAGIGRRRAPARVAGDEQAARKRGQVARALVLLAWLTTIGVTVRVCLAPPVPTTATPAHQSASTETCRSCPDR
ncbi:FtsW/RodA/SpoVE family cell cycle protein [Nocardia lasii]|uniref:Probable peptidoglycan glycosyltransferase FtsW n=1 Tax=Nocardia lasii TaxID=1616107 RepID=A0ABW1JSI3_9NOCA